jgi:nicotinate-nucleotide adenylyltransferase
MARHQIRRRKVGIFDFTGNPITLGHLVPAASVLHDAKLDEVRYTVSRTPPNKRVEDVLDAELRHEFAVIGTAEHPQLGASRVNLKRRGISYAINTVEGFLADNPGTDAYYMLSGEYLDPQNKWWIKHWVGGPELFKVCKIVIFPRYDQTVSQLKAWAKLVPEAKIEVYEAPSLPISATLIRGLVAQGRSIRYLTTEDVRLGVLKSGAFRTAETPAPQHFDPAAPIRHVGVFLADFDPITYGDLRAAEVAREEFGLDRVEFVPRLGRVDGGSIYAPAEVRYEMVAAGVADNEYFRVTRADLERETVSHALLTAHDMRMKYGESVKLSMLIYADDLEPSSPSFIGRWMGTSELFKMVRFIAVPTVRVSYERALELSAQVDAAVDVVNAPPFPVDAAGIRERLAQGRCISYNTPRTVEHIITANKAYGKVAKLRTARGGKRNKLRRTA